VPSAGVFWRLQLAVFSHFPLPLDSASVEVSVSAVGSQCPVPSFQFPVPSSQFSVLSSQPHRIFLSQTVRNETPAEQFANYSQLRRELSRRLRATTTKRRQWQWQLLLQHRRCPSAALSFPQPSPHPHPHPQPRRRGPSSSSCVKFVLSFSVSKCAKRFQSNSDARAEKTFGPVCWPT